MTQKIVGAFRSEEEATRAIEDLKSQGFRADEISVIAKDRGERRRLRKRQGRRRRKAWRPGQQQAASWAA